MPWSAGVSLRFAAMREIEKNSIPEPNSGCLLWMGPVSESGYGIVRAFNTTLAAHRISYEVAHSVIPSGMVVCHKCDVPSCVNPLHLFVGTQKDNVRDMLRKGRNTKKFTGRTVKLDAEKVRQILLDTRPNQEVAETHWVSRRLIDQVRKREIWRHVPDPREMVGR